MESSALKSCQSVFANMIQDKEQQTEMMEEKEQKTEIIILYSYKLMLLYIFWIIA